MQYRTAEVAQMLDVNERTLLYWASIGLVSPRGGGRRRPWKWSPKHVREVSVIAGLRQAGITMQALREAWGFLRSVGHNPGSSGQFVVLSTSKGKLTRDVVKLCDGGEALNLAREHRGQLMLIPVWEPTDRLIGDKKGADK